ncbi:unnamed protein product [Owenia fusiformis]|uniref:PPM-type phosphatase domain-containing protein n=1 Tax=Owenia fusiformis TaxID=6347 RepID=A0A8S4NI80_OWEFU|nr:unnamed protein product [Owenia fusiformis]
MSYGKWISRLMRRHCLSIEGWLTAFLCIFVYLLVFHRTSMKNFFQKTKIRFQIWWKGCYTSNCDKELTNEKVKASWELRKGNVGVYAIQGRRNHMEDRFNVVLDLEHTGTSIYGIFDGHGGEFAADFTEKTLFKTIMVRLLKAALAGSTEDLSALLTEEFLYVDKQLLAIEKATNEVSGTTALIAMVKDNILTVANVGDSRGVLCDCNGKAVALSIDHKPQLLKERKRIKKAGGFISFNGVWRVVGVLATSRAMGDYPLKEKNFVIAEPDVLTFDLNEVKPDFMILATDGLWDAFSNEEAVMYVKERLDEPHFGAKSLVFQAYYRGSLDNISVMIVNFKAQKIVTVRNGMSA